MSALGRTALRLAGIAALRADPVIAALCAGRVFDSRIEALTEREPVPVITVLTEEMEGEAWAANNGGPPFDDRCELVLEIAMRAAVQDEDAEPYIGTPATSAELEAALDLIEERAVEALTVGDTAESLLVRRAVTRRVAERKSVRFVDAETGVKLAERTVTLGVALKGDDQRDANDAPAGEFARLPNPLRAVCEAMTDGSDGQAICRLIAEAMPAVTVDAFDGADVTYAPQPDLAPDAAPIPPDQTGSHDTFGQTIDIP